jgi:fermentation-respiration switch protein FrsA (DUF1100 family)
MIDLDAALAVVLRKRRLPFPSLLARLITRRAGQLAGVPLHRPRPCELAPEVSCPILVIHGTDDTLVSPAEAGRLANAFPSPASLIDVPGAGHTDVIEIGGEVLLERIAAFLSKSV